MLYQDIMGMDFKGRARDRNAGTRGRLPGDCNKRLQDLKALGQYDDPRDVENDRPRPRFFQGGAQRAGTFAFEIRDAHHGAAASRVRIDAEAFRARENTQGGRVIAIRIYWGHGYRT
jgi:hypothetical protein